MSITIDGKATMVYPSGSIAYGDFYAIAGNGQGVVIKNSSTNVTNAKAKGITPIAMVFHTSPSSTDQTNSWTHGYAMGLKRPIDNRVTWAPAAGIVQTQQYGAGNITNLTNEINRAKANLDGYTETNRILAKTSNKPSTSYPACYYAVTYSVTYPKSSSGWYLPSVGQIYYLFNNAKSNSYSLISVYAQASGSNTRIGISSSNGSTLASIITSKLSSLSAGDYTWGDSYHIWLSSECSSEWGLIFYFGNAPDGLWYIYPHYRKAIENAGVRSFIAF